MIDIDIPLLSVYDIHFGEYGCFQFVHSVQSFSKLICFSSSFDAPSLDSYIRTCLYPFSMNHSLVCVELIVVDLGWWSVFAFMQTWRRQWLHVICYSVIQLYQFLTRFELLIPYRSIIKDTGCNDESLVIAKSTNTASLSVG